MKLFENLHSGLFEAKEDPDIEVVNMPTLHKERRIKDMMSRFGESRFKKFDEEDFFKTKTQGFFFHYNPTDNKYYESNASFQFMFFSPRQGVPYSPPPDIEDYWNHFNFKVDRQQKIVFLEKQWSDSKLVSYVVESIKPHQVALQIAVSRHPEIADFKLRGTAMAKTVEEFLELPSADDIGTEKDFSMYIPSSGEKAREYLENGIKEEEDVRLYLSRDRAVDDAKHIGARDDPDNVWTVLKVEVNGKDPIKQRGFGSFDMQKDIPADKLEVAKVSQKDYFKKERNRREYTKYKSVWSKNASKFYIASKEEVQNFLQRADARMRDKRPMYNSYEPEYPGFYHITLKKGPRIYVADQEKANEKELESFVAYIFLSNAEVYRFKNSKEIIEIRKDPERAHAFVFEGKLEGGELAKEILDKAFQKDFHDVIEKLIPPEEILNANS